MFYFTAIFLTSKVTFAKITNKKRCLIVLNIAHFYLHEGNRKLQVVKFTQPSERHP